MCTALWLRPTIPARQTIKNNFANITDSGGNATFQFDSYEEAKAAYDQILKAYQAKGTVEYSDLKNAGLTD